MSDDMNNLLGWIAKPVAVLVLGAIVSGSTSLVIMKVAVPQMQAKIQHNAERIDTTQSDLTELSSISGRDRDGLTRHEERANETFKALDATMQKVLDRQQDTLISIAQFSANQENMNDDIRELKDEMKQLREDRSP